MSFRFSSAAMALSLVLFSFVALPGRALAHETRSVGKYQLVVGFFVEPAFEGQKNGLDLRVRVPGTPVTPVTGLEKTLQVEISFVGVDKSVTKPVRAVSAANEPGRYTADVLPTQSGQYRFRIFGEIEGVKVNETFTSGEKFSNVEKASELTFPDALPQIRSVEGAAAGAQDSAYDALQAASTARAIAIGALAVAVIASGVAFRSVTKK